MQAENGGSIVMDWKKIYEDRKMSADEAVKLIKSGDTVVLAHCVAEPVAVVDAMVANKNLYKGCYGISHGYPRQGRVLKA